MTKKTFIIDALRTPIANFGGSLKSVSAIDLGTLLISEIIKRNNLQKDALDGVILGNVLQAGLGQNPARQCGLMAGLAESTSAFTINKVCGSGMKAVDIAYKNILAGDGGIFIAGGMESMSNAPYLLNGARWGYKIGDNKLIDEMVKDGLWCPYNNIHMGSLIDDLAREYNITRKAQDIFSLDSHIKAVKAIDDGRFTGEIIPVDYIIKKGKKARFVNDEHPRKDTTLDKLSSLRPAFSSEGTVTAGNASGINDGAAALLIASASVVEKLGLKPLAEIISISEIGVEPKYFGTAPITATRKALSMADLTINDIELAELNEAFAAQTLIVMDKLGIDRKIVNVNGGAVAMGHPIGASGARIVVTLLHEMIKRDSKLGLASLCIGSGEGMAAIIKRVAV
ncbi:MAG: acetyl-CoA C-acetyltransferase [Actinomycetia bacterium]|nr:acetyl-CoA C-acetyltransferase [Actinomycetes bacterium]